ncbi:MAG TPA: hypothetical protein VGM98_00475 [Schlesneria sp.]|jgi:predicted phage tail protein
MKSTLRFIQLAVGFFVIVVGAVLVYCAFVGQLSAVTREGLSQNTSMGIIGVVVALGGYLLARNAIEDDILDED